MSLKRYALLSVSDKSGLAEFAKALQSEFGFTLLSTGGTAKLLAEAQIPVTEVSDYTGFPEMMDGRVKTLHPKIHGGLLARRDLATHMESAEVHGIGMIDMVVVNLYPFEATIVRADVTRDEAIEQIDIGGPSMLRSAAKNHATVTVVCDPNDYTRVLDGLRGDDNRMIELRKELALKVFKRTANYDRAIANYLENSTNETQPNIAELAGFPCELNIVYGQEKVLRYGENPHQHAALYGQFLECFEQLQGKELSFNNIIDISAATYLIGEFQKPTVAILKHTNPCGAASADNLVQAWEQAFATDQQAPFGGIIVVNQTVTEDFAQVVKELFCEVIIAPGFSDGARTVFAKKKNLRLMTLKQGLPADSLREIRSVVGGILVQDRDHRADRMDSWKVVSQRQPTAAEWAAMQFGWKVVKHVKSNAIVYAAAERTLGIGAGQMSRVDSSKIAVWKATEAGLTLNNSIIASDAFFPFPDGLIAAAEAGATAAIQPGGSMRDEAVIAAANERDMAMVFTGMRHFKH